MTMIQSWFDNEGHLTNEGISLWVDHLEDPLHWPLPGDVEAHGETCIYCKGRIVELSLLLKAEDPPLQEPHPNALNEGPITCHTLKDPSRAVQKPSGRRIWYALAAVMILLIATVYVVWDAGHHAEMTGRELFAEHFVPYPDAITTKSESMATDTLDAMFRHAMQAYSSGEYDMARLMLSEIHSLQPEDQTVSFYLANVKLARLGVAKSGQERKIRPDREENDPVPDVSGAVDLLLPIARGEGPYAMPSRWYLALTSVAMEDPAMARYWLGQIPDEERYYREKAAMLLNELPEQP